MALPRSRHGAGRASYLVEALKPANLRRSLRRPRPEDVVLTIVTDTPLAASETGRDRDVLAQTPGWPRAMPEADRCALGADDCRRRSASRRDRCAVAPRNFDAPPPKGSPSGHQRLGRIARIRSPGPDSRPGRARRGSRFCPIDSW